jgi:hypothetical protein
MIVVGSGVMNQGHEHSRFYVSGKLIYFPLLHFKENVTSLVLSKIGSFKMCCKLSTGVSTGLYEL